MAKRLSYADLGGGLYQQYWNTSNSRVQIKGDIVKAREGYTKPTATYNNRVTYDPADFTKATEADLAPYKAEQAKINQFLEALGRATGTYNPTVSAKDRTSADIYTRDKQGFIDFGAGRLQGVKNMTSLVGSVAPSYSIDRDVLSGSISGMQKELESLQAQQKWAISKGGGGSYGGRINDISETIRLTKDYLGQSTENQQAVQQAQQTEVEISGSSYSQNFSNFGQNIQQFGQNILNFGRISTPRSKEFSPNQHRHIDRTKLPQTI